MNVGLSEDKIHLGRMRILDEIARSRRRDPNTGEPVEMVSYFGDELSDKNADSLLTWARRRGVWVSMMPSSHRAPMERGLDASRREYDAFVPIRDDREVLLGITREEAREIVRDLGYRFSLVVGELQGSATWEQRCNLGPEGETAKGKEIKAFLWELVMAAGTNVTEDEEEVIWDSMIGKIQLGQVTREDVLRGINAFRDLG